MVHVVYPIEYARVCFVLCIVILSVLYWLLWVVINLSALFRVTSLALWQVYTCPSASQVTLTYMAKTKYYQTVTKHNKIELCSYFMWCLVHSNRNDVHVRASTFPGNTRTVILMTFLKKGVNSYICPTCLLQVFEKNWCTIMRMECITPLLPRSQ